MGLWVAFGFGGLVGAFIGLLIGRLRSARGTAATPALAAPPAQRFAPPEVQHVVLDEGSANVLNALNNRLAATVPPTGPLHSTPTPSRRPLALMSVRRARR